MSTSVERVYTFVKQSIMDFSLKPGESTEIAKRIGISRTPVREALRQLKLKGLLLHIPRRGWTVRLHHLEIMLVRQATRN
ncbi:MAG TPA: GntR family transcriptional regulator [Candidatus Acidoferrum sp.]|nr:GntR family transcriptional regulator [Candidatus Acidoferrum sp.]